MNKAIEDKKGIHLLSELRNTYNDVVGIKNLSEKDLIKMGFKDIENPIVGLYQKLGELYFDQKEDIFKYEIIDFSDNEIKIQLKEDIKNRYELNKINGWNAYQDFRAGIVIEIKEGKITETQAFMIESVLGIAYNKIAGTGDWKTAYFELTQVKDFPEFIKSYYDKTLQDLGSYILENYD